MVKNKNKKILYVILIVSILLVIAIGVTYALWVMTKEQTGENVVSTSCLNVTIENEEDNISLKNAFPKLDEEGLKSKPYKFSIKNNCEAYADYTINLEMLNETTLNSEYVKITLNEEGDKGVGVLLSEYKTYEKKKASNTKEGREIKSGRLKPSEEKNYELRVWIDEDVTKEDSIENSIYKAKIVVESVLGEKPYTESILNGTDPVLDGGLVPIKISEEDGSVTRADETEKWYSYAEQQWANAVILKSGVEDPGANEAIEESDIESYFVWIPRYRYEIFDEGNYEGLGTKEEKEQIINIEFENKDEPVKSGTTKGQMLTHPAFTSFNTNGIWVGKFETGYDGAESTTAAQVNPIDETASIEAANKVIIKPNVYSWRGIQVAKAYVIGRNYEATLNSHMMKNMEWGAVAYLQNSEYGSHASVRINNNSDCITGYAARYEPTIGYTATNELCSNIPEACNEYGGVTSPGTDGIYNTNYFNKESVVASTTNNYTGVFDMSGGAWEYMMSGIDDNSSGDGKTGKVSSGQNNTSNSGFNGLLTGTNEIITGEIKLPTDSRYYDKYDHSTSNTTYNRGKLGDSTKEMGPFYDMENKSLIRKVTSWYNDEAFLICSDYPWLRRGGDYYMGAGSGVVSFGYDTGFAISNISFRLVLAF